MYESVAKLPCGEVTVAKLLGTNKFNLKSSIKFFTTRGNLKFCFGVDNVNFRCVRVWRSYCVAKLLATIRNKLVR